MTFALSGSIVTQSGGTTSSRDDPSTLATWAAANGLSSYIYLNGRQLTITGSYRLHINGFWQDTGFVYYIDTNSRIRFDNNCDWLSGEQALQSLSNVTGFSGIAIKGAKWICNSWTSDESFNIGTTGKLRWYGVDINSDVSIAITSNTRSDFILTSSSLDVQIIDSSITSRGNHSITGGTNIFATGCSFGFGPFYFLGNISSFKNNVIGSYVTDQVRCNISAGQTMTGATLKFPLTTTNWVLNLGATTEVRTYQDLVLPSTLNYAGVSGYQGGIVYLTRSFSLPIVAAESISTNISTATLYRQELGSWVAYSASSLPSTMLAYTWKWTDAAYSFRVAQVTEDRRVCNYSVVDYARQVITGQVDISNAAFSAKAFMPIDASVTQSNKTTVAAYTSADTAAKAYDLSKLWMVNNYSGQTSPSFARSGSTISTTKNVVIDANASNTYSETQTTITLKSSNFTDSISTSGTITFLNGAKISGVYTSSAGTSTAITVNINNAGARLRLTDSNGVEQYNAVVSGTSVTLYYPPSSTGSWSGAVELFGYVRQTFALTVTGGGSFSASVVMIPDATISAPIATVSAYTALDTSQKIRDLLAYYNQTATGIAAPQSPVLTASSLNIGALTLAKGGTLGLSGSVLTTGSTVLSGVSIVTTGTQAVANLPTLSYPQQFTDATGSTNWLKVNLSAGQVAQDSYNNSYQTSSYTTFLPASYTLATSLVITARGYKKQSLTVPYSASLLPVQSVTLIPDASVSDTTTDFLSTATALTSEQQMYDAYSQYQATATGILDTYQPSKSPGVLDFGSVSAVFSPSATATLSKTGSTITYKVGTVNSGTYYSTGSVDVSLATLSNSVLIRASNLDSELLFSGITSIAIYSSQANAQAGTSQGAQSTNGIIRFKYNSALAGVTMSGTVYGQIVISGLIQVQAIPLTQGDNVLNLGATTLLQSVYGALQTVNSGVQKASLLIPHTTSF